MSEKNEQPKPKAPVTQITISQKEYEELKQEVEKGKEWYDQYLRAYAELENTRKRFSKEKSELAKFATIELMLPLLTMIDNFDRALESLKTNDQEKLLLTENPLLAGVELIRNQFHTFLDQQGVRSIQVVGEKFDPRRHEALMEVEKEDVEEGTIIEEIQKGYTLHERLIRPAVVKLAKKPIKKE